MYIGPVCFFAVRVSRWCSRFLPHNIKKSHTSWLISSRRPRPNALMWSPGSAPQQRRDFTEYHQVYMNSEGINRVQNDIA